MNLVIKKFDELTAREVYELLKARAEIFVVEQNCPYQDMDGKDYDSVHIFYEDGGKVIACLRVFQRNADTVQFGRILTLKHGDGLGRALMEQALKFVKDTAKAKKIYLEGQTYCIGFYEKFGFEVTSDEFILDGIPHVTMQLKL